MQRGKGPGAQRQPRAKEPGSGQKKKPTSKGGLLWPLMDTRKGGAQTRPNGPGLVIIAQMFENVKPLRRISRSGKVKGGEHRIGADAASAAARLDP